MNDIVLNTAITTSWLMLAPSIGTHHMARPCADLVNATETKSKDN